MDSMTMSERILIMVKNKVVLKERDVMEQFSKFYWRNGGKVCGSNGLG